MGDKYNESTGYRLNPVSKRWEKINTDRGVHPSAAHATASAINQDMNIAQDPYKDYSTEELQDFLTSVSDKEASDPSNDDARTELCKRLAGKESKQQIDSQSVVRELSDPGAGMTADMIDGSTVQHGFPYSPYPERSQAVHYKNITPKDLDDYVNNNRDLLSKPGNFLGLWHDPDSGLVYIDISVVTDDAAEARKQCLEKDQLAFFDLQTFQTVTVNENASSGGAKQTA